MVTTDESKYVKENTLTYYILINTWGLLWKNFAQHAYLRFLTHISDCGLIHVINECQEEAMRLIKQEAPGPWARILAGEFHLCTPVITPDCERGLIGVDELTTILFLLRYPKRFSPSCNDMIQDKTLDEFLETEKRNKAFQRKGLGSAYYHFLPYLQEAVKELYPWEELCDQIENILKGCSDDWLPLPPGSSLFTPPATGAKIGAVVRDDRLKGFIHPIMDTCWMFDVPRTKEHGPTYSKVLAVPKSYKASRIIAMEDIYRNIRGLQCEELFRRYDAMNGYSYINIEDQTKNQRLAQLGSQLGSIATLDASHASDLITRSLFIDVFPKRYTRLIMTILPENVLVRGKYQPMQMLSTSGHTLTFRHETIVYNAIARVAEEIYGQLFSSIPSCAWAFGDDTTVHSQAYDIAVYLFKVFGLKINQDKSFAAGPYRESCGKEYWNGQDISGVFYPRFPIVGSVTGDNLSLSKECYRDSFRGKLDNSLTMLIDLQKKLFPYSYEAARLLASIVQWAYPSVTTSVPGTVCSDLWDFAETGKTRRPRAWEIVQKDAKARSLGAEFRELPEPMLRQLHGDNLPVFERAWRLDKVHTYPSVGYLPRKGGYTDFEVRCYEYWKYRRFLQHGPQYEDELLKLLGVSNPPMSIAEFFGTATLRLSSR
jgi:hypothetical protein